jgi:DNA-binding NarL/FixJ family response regulator
MVKANGETGHLLCPWTPGAPAANLSPQEPKTASLLRGDLSANVHASAGANVNGHRERTGPTRLPLSRGMKRPRAAALSGGPVTTTKPHCGLCTCLQLLRQTARAHATPRGASHPLRIALLNGHEDARFTLRDLLKAQRSGWTLEVYHPPSTSGGLVTPKDGTCALAQDINRGHAQPPDVVLMYLSGTQRSRVACVRRIKVLAPHLPVMIIGAGIDGTEIAEYCAAGADGYLLKPPTPEALARAVDSLAQGWPVLCPEAQKRVLDVLQRAGAASTVRFPGLSSREQEIAGCLVAHLSDKEISTRLGISEATVHVHLTRLYRKLGVHSRRQAVAKLLGVAGEWRSPF